MEKLEKDALEYDFQVKSAQNGIYMMPVLDGKALKEEEFDVLDEELKAKYEEKSETVQQMIMDIIGKIKQIERMSDKKINEWQSNIALITVNTSISYIKSQFKRNKKINKFLDNIKNDIVKNIDDFLAEEPKQEAQVPGQKEQKKPWLNYKVNLFVDNSEL